MEDLTEQIASELGPKWVQLFSRLQLGHRDRYRICAEHKNDPKPVMEVKCARETIKLWQKGLSDLPERDVMTKLLMTFKTVKGFEERAKQLADSYEITLVQPQVQSLPPTASELDSISTGTPHTNTTSTDHPVTESTPHASPPVSVTERTPHSSVIDSTSEGGSDVESSHSSPALHRPTHTTKEFPPSRLRKQIVDISVTKHKYAILDICQRLPASILSHFAQRLNVPLDKVREISANFSMKEERYYQVLKYWLSASKSGGTFEDLQGALESCQQQPVCDVIDRRLQTTGLTLRSPAR
jgi:hypothetical protein